jgi:hypothetical protein
MNGNVQLWDMESGTKTGVLKGLSGYVLCTGSSERSVFEA